MVIKKVTLNKRPNDIYVLTTGWNTPIELLFQLRPSLKYKYNHEYSRKKRAVDAMNEINKALEKLQTADLVVLKLKGMPSYYMLRRQLDKKYLCSTDEPLINVFRETNMKADRVCRFGSIPEAEYWANLIDVAIEK